MRFKFLYSICGMLLFNIAALADDSIPAKELDEIVVTGENRWISKGVINAIPTKQEKKLSNSPETLIESMHFPNLKVEDGSILTEAGEKVEIFINGEKADKIDEAAFWPKNVQLVQYMQNPSDPTYQGARNVINFKMPVYEVGGVSKVNGFQRIPEAGGYTLTSKLAYKKMTYGLYGWFGYSRDHRTNKKGETKYSDLYYDGRFYDEIIREEESSHCERSNYSNVALNARYSTGSTRITHTVSFDWYLNPGSGSHSTDSWSNNLFGSNSSDLYDRLKRLSPQFRGDYYFRLSNKWYLSGLLNYIFSRNNSYSSAVFGDSKPVENSVDEDVNTLTVAVQPSFYMSQQLQFFLLAQAKTEWFSSHYSGSTNVREHQSRQRLSSNLKIYWQPKSSLMLYLSPGVLASLWQIGDVRQHTVSPVVDAYAGWNPVSRFTLTGNVRFHLLPPTASESNSVMMKTSELLWALGNPYLKGTESWDFFVSSTYLPVRWLTLNLGVGYDVIDRGLVEYYTPAPAEYGGLIRQTVNVGATHQVRSVLDVKGSFFDDNLYVGLEPSWHWYKAGDKTLGHFSLGGSADYSIGNCRFSIEYEGPHKDLSADGMETYWGQDRWNFSFTYGTGDFYMNFSVDNIFNNKRKSWNKFESPYYSSRFDTRETGRTFFINASYTFGYGKKIDKNIDIKGPESTSTSVYRSDK